MTKKPLTHISITLALLLGSTGCTLAGNSPENENTATTASTPTATTATAVETTPAPEADAATIREGTYLDAWAANVTRYFQRAANDYLHQNDEGRTLSPGDLQAFLDERIATDTPDAFEVKATTTSRNHFTIKVWHPNGHEHADEDTAYIGSSDPEVQPSPTASPSETTPAQQLDEETKTLLYEAGVAIYRYMNENGGEVPSDDYMRTNGYIPEGWDWSFTQDEFDPEFYTVKVWNDDGFLFNSEDTAATYTSYPQPEMRPAYNYNIEGYAPIVGFTIPESELTPAPSPSPPAGGANP